MEKKHPLRVIREQLDLSIDDLAEEAGLSRKTILRAEQGCSVYPSSRRILCRYISKQLGYHVTSQEIGLLIVQSEDDITTTDAVELDMDTKRRKLLTQAFGLVGTATVLPSLRVDALERLVAVFTNPSKVDEPALEILGNSLDTLWQLSNGSNTVEVEQELPLLLPKLVTLAHQPTRYQQKAAHLASQGYILAAEVDRGNIHAMNAYSQQAVLYSQIAQNYDIQAAAIKQQATMLLIGKDSYKALQKYQEALPLINHVSPLLRSRIYLGLASASARCGEQYKQQALRYLGFAQDSFPEYPESDQNYLYTICSKPVQHLYEALTFTDLNLPKDAWQSLIKVDGLQPKMPVPESTRIEFINLQAKTAAALGNMEQSCAYLQTAVDAADKAGYSVWREEAAEVHQEMMKLWPHELQVRRLGKLFQKGA